MNRREVIKAIATAPLAAVVPIVEPVKDDLFIEFLSPELVRAGWEEAITRTFTRSRAYEAYLSIMKSNDGYYLYTVFEDGIVATVAKKAGT